MVAAFTVEAQTVNLHGKISNQAGQAVSGAVVELNGLNMRDTTGSDGVYFFSATTGIRQSPLPFTEHIALNGSVLELVLSQSQTIKLEVFDARGTLLKRKVQSNAPAGTHNWNLSQKGWPSNILFVKTTVGGQVKTFRYPTLAAAGHSAQHQTSEEASIVARRVKAADDVDTLTVTASGYQPMKVPVTNYDTTINVTLVTGYPLKNPPVSSAGCGKMTTITTSTTYRVITSSGDKRQYMITMPPNYDMNKPYRYIYASHGLGGEGSDITREKYYSLQNIPEVANSTIFVSASGLGGIWGLKDVPLFDDILAFVEQNACVDKSRVFVLGFSFGGMYSYSLSKTRQKVIRAGIGMSPANYNISIPTKSHEPISWMQSTGMSDGTCPWVNNEAQKRGAKFIAIEHGTDNGCTVPNPIPTWKSGGMLCVDFDRCKPGYLTKICTFNGGHGLPGGFTGAATWMWDFISQF